MVMKTDSDEWMRGVSEDGDNEQDRQLLGLWREFWSGGWRELIKNVDGRDDGRDL